MRHVKLTLCSVLDRPEVRRESPCRLLCVAVSMATENLAL